MAQRKQSEDNIKMDIREIDFKDRKWMELPQAVVSAGLGLRVLLPQC